MANGISIWFAPFIVLSTENHQHFNDCLSEPNYTVINLYISCSHATLWRSGLHEVPCKTSYLSITYPNSLIKFNIQKSSLGFTGCTTVWVLIKLRLIAVSNDISSRSYKYYSTQLSTFVKFKAASWWPMFSSNIRQLLSGFFSSIQFVQFEKNSCINFD